MLTDYIESWSTLALEKDWVAGWVEGAILPREMVFFMARCQELGIRVVIESGRQDGYSTLLLGEYARRMNGTVYSIDYEADAERAARCHQRLSKYPEIKLLKGDSNVLVNRIVRQESQPSAILMDGPKGFWAMSLMFSAAEQTSVQLVSLHNLDIGLPARQFFEQLSDYPAFYEQYLGGPNWERLMVAEVDFCERLVPGRLAKASSLGVMRISERVRERLLVAKHPSFKLFQPRFVRLGWRLHLDLLTSVLFTFSNRFLG